MKQIKTDINVPVDDLAAGLVEIQDLLAQLSRGDTSMRVAVNQGADIFSGIKMQINLLAEHLQKTNDYAHEMAIGLCEHYDTLNRISEGDFSARSAVDSSNELVAKLGELINKEADTLTSAISRVQQAEDETKNAYQQLMDIVEFLPDATFVVDKHKRVIAWNRAIEIMTGLEKHEVLGKGDYVYALPFYGERRPILIDLLGETQETVSRDYTCIKKEGRTLFTEASVSSFRNGESRDFWAAASPLLDKHGEIVGAIESIRDITEYKKAEEEQSRLKAQLHHARMLESLMVKLGHDLKTPLTPLCILLPIVRERVADPDLKKMLDICCKNTISIKELIEKTGKLVKLSSDIEPHELGCIQLSSAADECLSECADSLSSKHLCCRNEIDPAIVVQVVPTQIQELFANLISNAVRYSSENGVIRIAAEQNGETVTVSVIDEGIGLAHDHLELIFDEFFKVDESRHDLEASGLGLSICKRVIQNHHGSIRAESAGVGRGTSIIFTINQRFNGVQHS